MSTLEKYSPSAATVAELTESPTIDKAAALARYTELCAIRDAVNEEVAPLIVEQEKAAKVSEAARVRAMELAAKIRETRGGGVKWRALKKEIGVLAKVTTGELQPSADDLKHAALILGGK
jgi:hypothetical protein